MIVASRIRLARLEDLAAINQIYNHYILHSTCTYQREPETPEDRAAWFAEHGEAHPVTVCERADPGAPGEILGWGALSPFRSRWGYRHTVENSVYVRHDQHGRGLGRALLTDLIDRARQLGHHAIIAGISADQQASVALHERLGFTQAGHLREVGHKFGRWLDVLYLERVLQGL